MKRSVMFLLIGFILGIGITGFAGSGLIAKVAGFKVLIDGQEYKGTDPAIEVNGRTYLPLSETGKALSVPVKWDGEKRRVVVGKEPQEDTQVQDVKLIVDGKEIPLPDGGYRFLTCIKNNELMINDIIISKFIEWGGSNGELRLSYQSKRIAFPYDSDKYRMPGEYKPLKVKTFMYDNKFWMIQASAITEEIPQIKFNLQGNKLTVVTK